MDQAGSMHPLTVGQMLDRSLRIFSSHVGLMVGIAAISVIPTQAVSVAQQYFTQSALLSPGGDPTAIVGIMVVSFVVLTGLSFLLGNLVTGALSFAVAEIYVGRTPTVGASLGRAWQRFPSILVASLVIGLFVGLGFLAFIVPGIILSLGYMATIPIIVTEGLDAREARIRSWQLMDGMKGEAFLLLLVIAALAFVPAMIAGIAFALLGLGDQPIYSGALSTVLTLFVTPIQLCAIVLIYYSARIRKENFDLDMLGAAFAKS